MKHLFASICAGGIVGKKNSFKKFEGKKNALALKKTSPQKLLRNLFPRSLFFFKITHHCPGP